MLAEQTYGQLHYGISTKFIIDAHIHLIRQSFFIAATEVTFSILLLALLGVWITRHLTQLRNASQSLAEGHYDIQLPVETRDEVGLLAATFNDMAARIRSQVNELRDSEARFRSLAELSSDWYWEQDADFRFIRHDAAGHLASQINPSHRLEGKCRWEMETTLTAAEMNAHRALNQAHQPFREFEYGTKSVDGQMRYFSVSGEPIFNASGIFTGTLAAPATRHGIPGRVHSCGRDIGLDPALGSLGTAAGMSPVGVLGSATGYCASHPGGQCQLPSIPSGGFCGAGIGCTR